MRCFGGGWAICWDEITIPNFIMKGASVSIVRVYMPTPPFMRVRRVFTMATIVIEKVWPHAQVVVVVVFLAVAVVRVVKMV